MAIDNGVELRRRAQKRKAALIAEREHWMQDWREVAEHVDPIRGKFDTSKPRDSKAKRSRNKIINNRATMALRVMAAGMMSHMTSKSRPWFRLSTPDPAMAEQADVRMWLDSVTNIVRDTLAKSNFYKAMPDIYTEDGMFGVAAMLALDDPEDIVGFYPLTVGSYAIGLNDQQRVDTLWRCYTKTARQLEERYGRDKLPLQVRTALETNKPDQKFQVESLFEPNPDAPRNATDLILPVNRRPFREIVWIEGRSDEPHGVLQVGGHYEFPPVVIRWNPIGGDVYSTAPALDSLGDIKQLQYLEGEKLRLLDLIANPPLGLPESLVNKGGSVAPGAITYLPTMQAGMQAGPLYTPNHGALQALFNEIREVETRIEEAFYYNLFMMLASLDERQRTATEIAERREEKAAVLGPSLEAVTDEGLDPVVIRVFKLLERAGRIPAPPPALENVPIKIEYTSILAQAAKAHGSGTIERLVQFVGMTAQMTGPGVLDKFDADQAIDEYGDRIGVPVSVIRSDEDVAALRQQRQQQEQMAMAAQMAPAVKQGADAVKALGEAVPQEGSVGAGLAEQIAGAFGA